MAKKARSRASRWVRKVDRAIDREKLERWIRRTQERASHLSRGIGRAIREVLLDEEDGEEEEEGDYYRHHAAYSSRSSRTFYDARGNRLEEVYMNGMLAERYVNGVPDVIY